MCTIQPQLIVYIHPYLISDPMNSFLFSLPSNSFSINTRTLACIFSTSIIIHLLIPLLLNTSITSLPHCQKEYHIALVKSAPYLCFLFSRTCITLSSHFSSAPKGILDNVKKSIETSKVSSSLETLYCSKHFQLHSGTHSESFFSFVL